MWCAPRLDLFEMLAQPLENFPPLPLFDLLFQFVNALIAQNHRVGKLVVALAHGSKAPPQRQIYEPGHFAELSADSVDVTLQARFDMCHSAVLVAIAGQFDHRVVTPG